MDRRKFLGAMVGGLAASAAVRTFPFRVFSFPKEIKTDLTPFERAAYASKKWRHPIQFDNGPVEIAVYGGPVGGPMKLIEAISLAEAKAKYGYEWRPGYAKTQQSIKLPSIYCAPRDRNTTGLIV